MNYGIPYMGSKSRIAEKIMDALPSASIFYDLFAGGGAMTHLALLTDKYEHVVMNDINPLPTQLFVDAAKGKYHNYDRWVSREEFFQLKDTDPYVKYCFSFGNDGKTYIYGRHIESTKRLMHELFFAKTSKDRRLIWKKLLREVIVKDVELKKMDKLQSAKNLEQLEHLERLERLEQLERLERLEHLERLERLEHLEHLERLERLERDYAEVPIKSDSVIYCDIPYNSTKQYDIEFDYDRFYDWACSQSVPVYISEYAMPEDRFECVLEIQSTQRMGKAKDNNVTEKLFIPRR